MDKRAKDFLFDLLNTPSPSGFESQGQRKWLAYANQFADSVGTDIYGTAWGILQGTGGESAPRVMIESHADEIGFMVNHVTDDGFLHVVRIGGSDRATARGKRIQILGEKGVVHGVIGNTAIHIRAARNEKVPEIHELFVDIGASSPEDVEKRGVRVGHPLVFTDSVEEIMEGLLTGRALDNRIGGFVIARVLERLAGEDRLPVTLLAVNSVQEEVGGHGAKMAAYTLRPSVAVVLDVTHATDSPGIEKTKFGDVKLGKGPTVTHGRANHVKVVDRLVQVGTESKIPIQHEACSQFTGTDTDDIFHSRSGVPSALISLPMRYMHSTVETVALEDVERCVDLLAAFVKSVREDGEFDLNLT